MDRLCPLNCSLELKLLLVIQLVPQTLNYAKSHTCIDFVLLGCMFEACGKAEERSLAFPILWKSSEGTSTSASNLSQWTKPHLAETGDNMHFLCIVRCWVHQGCWPRLLHSGLTPSFCSVLFSFSPISTSYMTGSIREFVPGKIEYYWNSSGLDLLSPGQHLFIFLSYRRLSKDN